MTITKQDLIELGCEPEHVEDWLQTRKDKRAPKLTQTALKAIVKQADLAGVSLAEAIEISAEEGWRGFKAEWLSNRTNQVQKAKKQGVRESLRDIHNTDW